MSIEQGFYLQVGGWNLFDSSEAIIIGMWVSPKEYYRFMDEFHDTVLTNSEQQRYYEEIDVKLWNTACVEKLTSIGDTIELFATRPECSNVSECTLIELEAVGTSKWLVFKEGSYGSINNKAEWAVSLLDDWTVKGKPITT